MTALTLTKKLAEARAEIVILFTLVAAILWFVPELTVHKELVKSVDFKFMGITLFSIPVMISRAISFVVWIVLLARMVPLSEQMSLIPVRSMLPYVFGILCVSCVDVLHVFDERLVAFVLLVHSMRKLCEMYSMQYLQMLEGFKMLLFVFIAALFKVEYVWMILLFVIGLNVYKVTSFKFILSALLSLGVVAWILWGIFWLADSVDILLAYFHEAIDFKLDFFHWGALRYAKIGFAASLLLLTRLQTDMFSYKYDLQVRLNNAMMGVAFWFAVLIMVVYGLGMVQFVVFMAIISLSLYFTTERTSMGNVIFLIVCVILLAYRLI